jgi:hypothetical protein
MRYVSDYIDALKQRQAEVTAGIAAGNAADYSAYQRLVGQLAGLNEALDILNNLLKEDDDDR